MDFRRFTLFLLLHWIKIQPYLFQEQKCSFDVAILIDVSIPICNSINVTVDCYNINDIIYRLSTFADSFEIGDSGTRFSFITFGDTAQVNWHLNKFNERISLLKEIGKISFRPSNLISTTDALRLLRQQVFLKSNGDRSFNKNIAILYAASNPSPFEESEFNIEVQNLELSNITVYVVGMTSSLNMEIMKKISSKPQLENHNWFTPDPDKIVHMDKLYSLICNMKRSYLNTRRNFLIYYQYELNFEDLDTQMDFRFDRAKNNFGKNIVAMKYSAKSSTLYFIEHDHPSVFAFNLIAGSTRYFKYLAGMKGLALNDEDNLIYVSFAPQSGISGIFSMTTSGLDMTIIISETNGKPWSLEYSVYSNELYWTDCSPTFPGIYKMKMIDGQSKIPIVTTSIKNPTDLAIDFKTGAIFWADSSLNQVKKSKMDGTYITILYAHENFYPISIALLNETTYIGQSVINSNLLTYNQTSNEIKFTNFTIQPLCMVFTQNAQIRKEVISIPDSDFPKINGIMLILIIVASILGLIIIIIIIVFVCIKLRKRHSIASAQQNLDNANTHEESNVYERTISSSQNIYMEMNVISK